MHVFLSPMYVSDPRFAEHYDKRRPGLAPQFFCDAVAADNERGAPPV